SRQLSPQSRVPGAWPHASLFVECLRTWDPVRPHFFFFNDPATTEIYTLSLHDALPISLGATENLCGCASFLSPMRGFVRFVQMTDRKSTRLNSSHVAISYAVFCLKKKKEPGLDRCSMCQTFPARRL